MKKLSIIVMSLLAFSLTYTPAFARDNDWDRRGDDLAITSMNSAAVSNCVVTSADTGGNTADGSYSGSGGSAGDIRNIGSGEVEDSWTGRGGSGGDSGVGGTVQSGDALAVTEIMNDINRNTARASDEGRITSMNHAMVANKVMTLADTGDNYAGGSAAGSGGDSGAIKNKNASMPNRSYDRYHHDNDNGGIEDSTTGNGGNGGDSGEGGMVVSGNAESFTTITNIVNRNITRTMNDRR